MTVYFKNGRSVDLTEDALPALVEGLKKQTNVIYLSPEEKLQAFLNTSDISHIVPTPIYPEVKKNVWGDIAIQFSYGLLIGLGILAVGLAAKIVVLITK
jgi:hypothetical protein